MKLSLSLLKTVAPPSKFSEIRTEERAVPPAGV